MNRILLNISRDVSNRICTPLICRYRERVMKRYRLCGQCYRNLLLSLLCHNDIWLSCAVTLAALSSTGHAMRCCLWHRHLPPPPASFRRSSKPHTYSALTPALLAVCCLTASSNPGHGEQCFKSHFWAHSCTVVSLNVKTCLPGSMGTLYHVLHTYLPVQWLPTEFYFILPGTTGMRNRSWPSISLWNVVKSRL